MLIRKETVLSHRLNKEAGMTNLISNSHYSRVVFGLQTSKKRKLWWALEYVRDKYWSST